jgi:hypothetical protein
MRNILTAGLLAGAVLGAALPGPARAAGDEQSYQGVGYVCTGVGEDRDDPRWAAYPAKVMLTTKSGAFVADGRLTIRDAQGKTVLEASCDAPWLLARLAPGRYQVTAEVAGHSQKGTLVVPAKGQAALTLRFAEIAG